METLKPQKITLIYCSGLLASLCSSYTHAAIVINEFDYDQPGVDNMEFIELYNNGNDTVSLDGYFIELYNGSNATKYRSIDLSGFNIGANSFFVVCGDSGIINCNYSFISSSSWFQNGAPDALALTENGNIIDSISYEGDFPPYTEGEAMSIMDSNTVVMSIGRYIDGLDTNVNANDFTVNCITPGTANITGSGNCSSPVSAVPVPAAVWLFGSGLLAITGLARRRA